jgi:hypothetical protein
MFATGLAVLLGLALTWVSIRGLNAQYVREREATELARRAIEARDELLAVVSRYRFATWQVAALTVCPSRAGAGPPPPCCRRSRIHSPNSPLALVRRASPGAEEKAVNVRARDIAVVLLGALRSLGPGARGVSVHELLTWPLLRIAVARRHHARSLSRRSIRASGSPSSARRWSASSSATPAEPPAAVLCSVGVRRGYPRADPPLDADPGHPSRAVRHPW